MLRSAQTLETRRLLGAVLRCGIAAVALGTRLLARGDLRQLMAKVLVSGGRSGALFLVIAVAGIAYLVVCLALRVEEVTTFWRLLSARFLRRAK